MKRMLVLAAWLVCLAGYPSLSYSQAGPAVHLKASNGQYVVAEGGGGGAVNANRPLAGPWETFTLIDKNGSPLMNGDAVNFKTATGHFLVAEGSGGREVLANRTAAGPWETFVMVKVRGSAGQEIVHRDEIALRASNGQYVVAEGGGGGVVNANRNAIGAWETFTLEVVGGAAPPPPPPSVAVPGATPAPAQPGPGIGPARPPLRPGFPAGVSPTPTPAPAPQPPGIQVPGRRPPIPVQPVEPDNRPPGPAPTNITPTAPGPTSVELHWTAPANAVGYLVQRGNEMVTASPITATSYTDGGRTPKTTYSYTVAALYSQGGQYAPGWSAPVNVVTPPILPPADLKATATGPTTIAVNWSARPGASGYILWRNGTELARPTSTAYSDQVPGLGSYTYQVAAVYQGIGVGERSSPVTANTPIWGFADTHNHQFANLGFGGLMFWGEPFDPRGIEYALAWCTASHGPGGLGDLIGPAMGDAPRLPPGATGIALGHKVGGYPEFDGWPMWYSKVHQQVYYEWLKRAYDGGLRLMVMLAVNNEAICGPANKAEGRTCDDMEAATAQLNAARALETYIDRMSGGSGKGWYRIVTSPQEAREAIYKGQLAVVLGIEVDTLFGCGVTPDRPCVETVWKSRLQNYYASGVRHIFPIHLTNNGFGGAALYHDVFNVNNKIITGNWFDAYDCSTRGIKFTLTGNQGLLVATALVALLLNPAAGATGAGAIALSGLPAYSGSGHCNPVGLTPQGETLIRELMNHRMIIDIDHMSWNSADRTLAIVKERNYPVIAGHTGFIATSLGKKKAEGQKNPDQLKKISDLGGMVALNIDQGKTDEDEGIGPYGTKVQDDCSKSSKTFLQSYLYAVDAMGGRDKAAVGIGSDLNGGVDQPGPRFGPLGCDGNVNQQQNQLNTPRVNYPIRFPGMTQDMPQSVAGRRTFNYNYDGMAHVGMYPDFMQDLRLLLGANDSRFEAPDLKPLFRSAEGYIQMWEKAEGGIGMQQRPPVYLHVKYDPLTATGGTLTVFAADWNSGAGIQGHVKLDNVDSGSVGASIAYDVKLRPTGRLDAKRQSILEYLPPKAVLSTKEYGDVSFLITGPVPRRELKLTVDASKPKTVTVTATDAQTGAHVDAAVSINGVHGLTGLAISYPACYEYQQVEVAPKKAGGPTTMKSVKVAAPCSGEVHRFGYEDADFVASAQPEQIP